MRKGADCLSKWVGESERQLRLLFDQAYQMRPSIIFFDEIDGNFDEEMNHDATVGQNNQESRLKYWATRLSVRSWDSELFVG